MLIEFLSHLASFDFAWIASLILGNLHWVFALAAFTVIAHKGKRPVWHFLVLVALLYAAVDVLHIVSWVIVPLLVFLPVKFLITIFTDNTSLEKHAIKIIVFTLFLLAFINTFYFMFLG